MIFELSLDNIQVVGENIFKQYNVIKYSKIYNDIPLQEIIDFMEIYNKKNKPDEISDEKIEELKEYLAKKKDK